MVVHNSQGIFWDRELISKGRPESEGWEKKNPVDKTLNFRFVLPKEAPGPMPIN